VQDKKIKKSKEEFGGILAVKEGVANTALVKTELKLYDEKWNWRVNQLDRDTFSLVFPNKFSQQHFTRLKSFEFNSAIVKAKISASDMTSGAALRLKLTWVRVLDMPEEFREEEMLKHVCRMIGKPEEVDKVALKSKWTNRVKIKCRDPKAINCSIEFCLRNIGYYIYLRGRI
jgi:hypothetical protein